jgi:hypothetical protein
MLYPKPEGLNVNNPYEAKRLEDDNEDSHKLKACPCVVAMIAVANNTACNCGDCRGKACLAPTQPSAP